MEKIKCSTPDFAKESAKKLLALFPECEGQKGEVSANHNHVLWYCKNCPRFLLWLSDDSPCGGAVERRGRRLAGNEVLFVGVEAARSASAPYQNAPQAACLDAKAKMTTDFFIEIAKLKPGDESVVGLCERANYHVCDGALGHLAGTFALDMVVPDSVGEREIVFTENWRKVYSNLKKKVAFACLVAEKGGRKLHIRERRDDEPAFAAYKLCWIAIWRLCTALTRNESTSK